MHDDWTYPMYPRTMKTNFKVMRLIPAVLLLLCRALSQEVDGTATSLSSSLGTPTLTQEAQSQPQVHVADSGVAELDSLESHASREGGQGVVEKDEAPAAPAAVSVSVPAPPSAHSSVHTSLAGGAGTDAVVGAHADDAAAAPAPAGARGVDQTGEDEGIDEGIDEGEDQDEKNAVVAALAATDTSADTDSTNIRSTDTDTDAATSHPGPTEPAAGHSHGQAQAQAQTEAQTQAEVEAAGAGAGAVEGKTEPEPEPVPVEGVEGVEGVEPPPPEEEEEPALEAALEPEPEPEPEPAVAPVVEAVGHSPAVNNAEHQQKQRRFNFASHAAGAIVLDKSPSAKGFDNLLDDDKDKYVHVCLSPLLFVCVCACVCV